MKQLLPLFLLLFIALSANAQKKFTVYFDFDTPEANTASHQKLQQWIAQNSDAEILKIYGYADKSGDAAYNQDLSERRALYVYGQLKKAQLYMNFVKEESFGESRATGNNNKEDRKVEIYYTVTKGLQLVEPEASQAQLTQQLRNAKVGDIILLKNLIFYGGTAYVLPESRPVLKELLDAMLSYPKLKIDIQGHICCDKDDTANLSGKRAEEIFLHLTNNGVDKSRVTSRGFRGQRPIYPIPEKTDEKRYANRRIEIEIVNN